VKNLDAATKNEMVAREETIQQNNKGKLLEFAFYLKKQGLATGTITAYLSCLNSLLTEGANLLDGESVKQVLALNESCISTTKNTKAIVYERFAKFVGLKWEKPTYRTQRRIPFLPTMEEVNQLIAGSPKKTATISELLRQTGIRIGEACRLEWRDINEKALTVAVNAPEKNSNPRICKVTPELMNMLLNLPKKNEKLSHKTTGKTA
jgi:integrase